MELVAELQPRDAPPADLSLRLALDPALFADDADFARYWTASKFGMDERDALAAARIAHHHPGLRLTGLHSHVGFSANYADYSPAQDLERHRRAAAQTVRFARTLAELVGVRVSRINFGGGFRVGRPEGFGPGRPQDFPSIAAYAQAVAAELAHLPADLGQPELLVEPGGYIVSDAVLLLGQVGLSKVAGRGNDAVRWVFLDNTTAYHFVRRMSSNFYHHVLPVQRRPGAVTPCHLAGPACSVDSIATHMPLPPLERGDVLAILDQGSYCEAISTDFCAIPIPGAVLVCDGEIDVVKRTETVEDISARYFIPNRLGGDGAR
jgi:diaminopimelate decarboxylase